MSPFDNSAKRIFQPTSKIWSVTSSQVVYFQHPLPPKKLLRGKPARRLAARSHRLFNPASAGGQADLKQAEAVRSSLTSKTIGRNGSWADGRGMCGEVYRLPPP